MSIAISRRSLLVAIAVGGTLILTAGRALATDLTSPRPTTIPALREWVPAVGSFRLAYRVRVVITLPDADRLRATAEVFAADLQALTGATARVIVRRRARRGQVLLRLGAGDAQLGAEGYRMDIGSAVTITANTAAGAFYGTRSLLQLLAQQDDVPAGTTRDWPRYSERGLMVDIGRKHITYEWLAERIRELAFLKLNYLHLHFTEDLGWRIESEGHPEIVSADHLSKQQVRDLIALAALHHIIVVPEVDLPGHMGAALAAHPEFQLRDVLGQANTSKLDYSIPEARQFARELVLEYLPLFPGPYWHTGADEFLPPAQDLLYPQLERYAKDNYGSDATFKDGLLGLVNEINALVRGHGKTLRVWHDGLGGGRRVTVDPNVDVEWWTDFSPLVDITQLPTPQGLLDAGHRIHNASWYPTYYSNLPPPSQPRPDLEGMYETWAVHRFRGALYVDGTIGTPYHDIDPAEPQNLGSKLHVWNDDPNAETEAQIAAGIFPRLRIMAQKTWESPALVPTYAEFAPIIDQVGGPP